MFVGDNFLTLFDRLSTKSTVTGKTGTFLGILGSVAFIVISFVLFIGPVIFYFKGDYIQGIFPILKYQRMYLYSGCDFKIAISFYQKKSGKLINHNSISNFLQAKVGYYSASGDFFRTDVNECNDDYFTEMENKTIHFNKQDCFTIPDGVQFLSQVVSSSTSVFGFVFQPVCRDPFLCVQSGGAQSSVSQQRIDFFSDHYYVLYFTTQYMDDYGNFKKKFAKLYSEEFSGNGIAISQMYALFMSQKIYLDNSIMPWFNNQTKLYIGWQGLTFGRPLSESLLISNGVGTFLAINNMQNVLFREYKKLDWLIGMLGGGIFLLFLIFWVPCNFVSSLKQKIQNCQSIVLLRNSNDTFKPNFSKLWYLNNLIPFKLKCCRNDNKIMYEAQRFLDIATIIKKLKVAVRNLKARKFTPQFATRNLQYNLEQINENYTDEQIKNQISGSHLEKIKNYDRIPEIYRNNISMLMLYDNEGNNETVQNNIKEITYFQKFSKISIPKFGDRQKLSCIRTLGKKIASFLSRFFKLFDVFGAKPNLVGNQQNFSGFGCVLTLFICLISILTFALTLGNMGVTRTYWDQIYVAPQNQTVKSTTGKQFRAAICISSGAFYSNLVIGQERIADFKFYQYKRQGKTEKYYYYDLVRGSKQQYFDIPSQSYNGLNLQFCFLPEDNLEIEVNGDATSQNESYVGFKIIPHCFGTPAYCEANKNTTYQKFYNLLSSYTIVIYYPQAKYYPDMKKVMITQFGGYFSQNFLYGNINLASPVQQQMYLDTLEMIDDYASWILGDYPSPKTQMLTKDIQETKNHLNSIQNYVGEPYYKLKIASSGKVKRIIFSSYKIDFLFATIGGCFVFYFFFFGCFGKAFNNYKMKVKLAEVLYNEDSQGISGLKSFLNWARVICCKDQVIKKIQNDIDCVRLAKNVDSVYRLSTAGLANPLAQNLSLIYLKERIKADEQVIIKAQQSSSDDEQKDDDFELDWQAQMRRQRQRLTLNAVDNVSDTDVMDQQANQKEQLQARSNLINQPMNEPNPTAKEGEMCGKFLSNFDIFHNNPQFTLDGKRSIQSVFGGIFCICMLIFICFLTSHFLTIYFSQFHRVSQSKIVDQDSEDRKMEFEVGKNFKFALSFYKINNYDFLDVSNITKDVGISVIKYKAEKMNGVFDEYQLQKIDLQRCRDNYLQGFLDPHQDPKYFIDMSKAYCVPDGTKLSLYGSTQDPVREYFSVKIYNKYGYNNTAGLAKVKYLLQNYLPRYHVTNPIVDYRVSGGIRYSTNDVLKSFTYQISTSREYNMTLTKNIIQYDTAVNPSNQLPSFSSYEIKNYDSRQFSNSFIQNIDRYNELSFYPEEFYNLYVIKSIKVNEIFGIVGGCIAFLFIGLGCIPRSYNAYKMRYMIGTKLYTILGKKKQIVIKNVKGKKSSNISKKDDIEELAQLSELQLMRAWILSIWGFIKSNYNSIQLMRYSSLIQSKVGKDINIFQFMKILNSCENGVRKMNLAGDTGLNLCRIYPKQIILQGEEDHTTSKLLVQDIRDHHPQLMDAARVNQFSEWELKIILQAKENNITIQNIFQQKWLDRFFGINRSSVASRSNYNRSEIRSQINSENPTKSLMEESNKDKKNEKLDNVYQDGSYMQLHGTNSRILSEQIVQNPKQSDEFEYELPDV